MNWAKGRNTRGRGTSFKGALVYVLHDKDAQTSERVGFVELHNLATDEPHRAWREMKALCDAADELKKRSGVKATGRKLTRPVYAFTLNWHEADNPDQAHMRETAFDALRTLGMEHCQSVIVEHTDRPHKHVHVIVNLVDPEIGQAVSLSNDAHKLDRWADNYEVTQGVIRSPDRRAKFHALDNGIEPPKRPTQAKSREEWEATRTLNGEKAKQRAADIKAAYAAHVANLKAAQASAFKARNAESEKLWNSYTADRKAVNDRYQPFIDAIWKGRRTKPPHPYTEQALHDLQESAEWKQIGRTQFAQRRLFNAREHSLLGAIGNAVRLHYAAMRERGGLASLFKLMISPAARRKQFERQQETEKQALRKRQAQSRNERAATLKAARRVELAKLSQEFQKDLDAMKTRHASEVAAQKAVWRQLAAEREKVWSDYRKEFPIPEPQQDKGDQQQSHRDEFREAASGTAKPERERKADKNPGNGADRAPTVEKSPRRDWRARRSAAERKADGSYKKRDRGKDDGGRSRQRDRYDHD
ncbi:relaxase/mobilization nuclease domain-containing protein [Methylocapsa sp. D3K7]|uniref:relaxase/mobilization nuclease domain-containing protein n=1 Tax=Methylocapsa sp. D3K7 TaxID=3041435 RepID=UPI00244EE8A7|nr:relaxase/mobilization nuclease domain-containing protein [Methylocapsa sp. D3K7]WGJ13875.1 relaxase/mobilization nuclease domain-containing protein [Methylocapsa sp. D3K7]